MLSDVLKAKMLSGRVESRKKKYIWHQFVALNLHSVLPLSPRRGILSYKGFTFLVVYFAYFKYLNNYLWHFFFLGKTYLL